MIAIELRHGNLTKEGRAHASVTELDLIREGEAVRDAVLARYAKSGGIYRDEITFKLGGGYGDGVFKLGRRPEDQITFNLLDGAVTYGGADNEASSLQSARDWIAYGGRIF